MNIFVRIGEFTHFAFRALVAAIASARRPGAVITQLDAVFIGALPLGVVAGVALGAVVWMHTHAVLARTGTAEYLPTALAAAVLLELAPIGAGLIVAAVITSSARIFICAHASVMISVIDCV